MGREILQRLAVGETAIGYLNRLRRQEGLKVNRPGAGAGCAATGHSPGSQPAAVARAGCKVDEAALAEPAHEQELYEGATDYDD